MGYTAPNVGVRSEEPTRRRMPSNGVQVWVNRHIQASILDIGRHVAWNDNLVLRGVVCQVVDEGWRVIVKAHRGAMYRVAFVTGPSYGEALELAAEFAERGCLTWQKDKWPPKGRS